MCYFCTNNLKSVDYKEAETLSVFLIHMLA